MKFIIWKFNAGDNANEKKRRKALKGNVGNIYWDTPMIDIRHTMAHKSVSIVTVLSSQSSNYAGTQKLMVEPGQRDEN